MFCRRILSGLRHVDASAVMCGALTNEDLTVADSECDCLLWKLVTDLKAAVSSSVLKEARRSLSATFRSLEQAVLAIRYRTIDRLQARILRAQLLNGLRNTPGKRLHSFPRVWKRCYYRQPGAALSDLLVAANEPSISALLLWQSSKCVC